MDGRPSAGRPTDIENGFDYVTYCMYIYIYVFVAPPCYQAVDRSVQRVLICITRDGVTKNLWPLNTRDLTYYVHFMMWVRLGPLWASSRALVRAPGPLWAPLGPLWVPLGA